MDSRVSHGLVAVAACILTAGVYEIRDALRDMASAMEASTAAEERVAAAKPRPSAASVKAQLTVQDLAIDTDGPDRRTKAERSDWMAARAAELGISLEEFKAFRQEKKADDRGLTPDELAERRQERRAPVSGADDLDARRAARRSWRESLSDEEREAHAVARREKRAAMSDEERDLRTQRRELHDQLSRTLGDDFDPAELRIGMEELPLPDEFREDTDDEFY